MVIVTDKDYYQDNSKLLDTTAHYARHAYALVYRATLE